MSLYDRHCFLLLYTVVNMCYVCVLIRCMRVIAVPAIYYCICVRMPQALLCMCPHTTALHVLCVLLLLYVCPHTTGTAMHVSSYYSAARTLRTTATICVSSYYRHCFVCVRIRYMCVRIRYMCVLIRCMCVLILQALLCMCPHTTALHVLHCYLLLYVCPHTTGTAMHVPSYAICVSSYAICVSSYAICVSSYYRHCYACALILQRCTFFFTAPHTELLQQSCNCNRAATLSSSIACFTCCSTSGCTLLIQSCNRAATELQQSCNSYVLYSPHTELQQTVSPHTELQQSCNRAATELQLIRSVLSSYRAATDCNRAATHTLCTLPHTSATICVLILLLQYMCPHTSALLACFTCCSTSGCTLADCKLN
jgi:hypothetical protein